LGFVVLASANPDKTRELEQILRGTGIALAQRSALPEGWQCEETGLTIEENALLKARTACASSGMPAISDDTGLFVCGLGGSPGVYASRFAGPGCSYEDNVRKLLRVLLWEKGRARDASFRTAAAFASPSGAEMVALGEITGVILENPRGSNGFGYDSVFFAPALGCTLAECPAEIKNELSHRGKALRALVEALGGELR
jgi:XTP/dITP diphosphohydrolase